MTASLFESLESRRLLSAASDIGLIDGGTTLPDKTHWVPLDPALYSHPLLNTAPVTPNIKRTYSGSYSLSNGVHGTFKLVVRKEDLRVGYAALRGTLDVSVAGHGTYEADMTYGKIRDNDRVNMTLVGTSPAFNVTITGKASASGSQIKGQMDVTGSVTVSTTFVLSKVVHS